MTNITMSIAQKLTEARNKAGISQDKMALELQVSRATIGNIEKGLSQPSLAQITKWYQVCEMSFFRPMLEVLYSDAYKDSPLPEDDKMINALDHFLRAMPLECQRGIGYIFLGEHGSDPISVIQLIVAYLHLPLQNRVSISRSIFETYDMCENIDALVCKDEILPNKDLLSQSIQAGKNAVYQGKKGYNTKNKPID